MDLFYENLSKHFEVLDSYFENSFIWLRCILSPLFNPIAVWVPTVYQAFSRYQQHSFKENFPHPCPHGAYILEDRDKHSNILSDDKWHVQKQSRITGQQGTIW